jgi:hypothetical protein
VDEDAGVQFLRGGEDIEELRLAEVPAVDVGADLHAGEAKLSHAAFQLLDRELRGVHGDRAKPGESHRMGAADRGDMVVEPAGKLERVLGPGPVAEHDGDSAEDLDAAAEEAVHLGDADGGIPAVGLDPAEEGGGTLPIGADRGSPVGPLLDAEHLGARAPPHSLGRDLLQGDPPGVAELCGQIRPLGGGRKDVGVGVDAGHGQECTARKGLFEGCSWGSGIPEWPIAQGGLRTIPHGCS